MSTLIKACAAVAVALVAGCTSSHPKLVAPDALPIYGVDPAYHTVYTGSDSQYHYFSWSRGLRNGQAKVDSSKLTLSREFARGTGKAFVKRTRDGKVDVLVLSKQTSEPDGAANRSQPVSPETNRTSAAAGSGR